MEKLQIIGTSKTNMVTQEETKNKVAMFKSILFKQEESHSEKKCGCGKSANYPYCDGTHAKL